VNRDILSPKKRAREIDLTCQLCVTATCFNGNEIDCDPAKYLFFQNFYKQVCVQLSSYTLTRGTARIRPPPPAERRSCSNRSISPTRQAHSAFAAVGPWWQRQTGGRTDTVSSHRPCSADSASNAVINELIIIIMRLLVIGCLITAMYVESKCHDSVLNHDSKRLIYVKC